MSLILRSLTALAAPAGPKSKLSVFYFHRVLEKPDPLLPYEPDARMFDRMLGWIGSQFRVLDPLEACARLYDGSLPSRPAVITFDDGYRDNYTIALPILRRHRMQAAFFVATGFLDGGAMFNDRVIEAIRRTGLVSTRLETWGLNEVGLSDIPSRRMAIERVLECVKRLEPALREERVAELESRLGCRLTGSLMMAPECVRHLNEVGMVVGGHTRTHPILQSVDVEKAKEEVFGCRADLAQLLGSAPAMFAYPNGKWGLDFGEREMQLVKDAGFAYAFSTEPAAASKADSRFALPRFTPWDRDELKFKVRALKGIVSRKPLPITSA